MKKKFLTIVAMVLLAVTVAVVFAGCASKPLTEEEQAVVGKYEITELSVVGSGISASSYDYFTLEFLSDRKCTVKSKAGTITYESKASWKINNAGQIEVITRSGFATATEVYTLSGNILSGTNTGPDGNGGTITMTVKFIKVTE